MRASSTILLTLCLLGLFATTICSNGVWMSTYDPSIQSESAAYQTLSSFAQAGINKVYVDVWNNGNLYASSNNYTSLTGQTNPDYLSNVLNAANSIGSITVVAWFEYGLIAAYGDASSTTFGQIAQSNGWIIGNANGYAWCDPSNSDFTNFFVNMIHEVKLNYAGANFEGIQLDDHFAWPTSLPGPDQSTRQTYMTNLAGVIANTIGQGAFSIAPNPMPISVDDFNVDWPTWMNNGWVYEAVPQTYSTSNSDFQNQLDTQLGYVSAGSIIAGIRGSGSGSPTDIGQVQAMITTAQSEGCAGISVWDSLYLETYLSQIGQVL